MYLAELTINNFRKLRDAKLKFQPGLNVLVGPNNVGKSAVVDALRTLLAGHDEPYPVLILLTDTVPTKASRQATSPSILSLKDSAMRMKQTSLRR